MALTVGDGPFGTSPAGRFNFDADAPERVLFVDPSPRRVRAVIAGVDVARSTRTVLLHETGLLPVVYFPLEDVRTDLLVETEKRTTCPFKGEARYYAFDHDGESRSDVAWSYPEPLEGAPDLSGHLAFYWSRVDEWWEEAERVTVHPRDPYHRCDVIDTDRHVVVEVDGEVVAESRRATMLFETGLPPRFYLPEVDVRRELLVPSETVTECPYKGVTTRYYGVRVGETTIHDAIWVYDHPKPEVTGIAGKLAFYNERVDLVVDGERWVRPVTRFS